MGPFVRTLSVLVLCAFASILQAAEPSLTLVPTEDGVELRVGEGEPFHVARGVVSNAALVQLPASTTRFATWTETSPEGRAIPYYALGLNGAPLGAGIATSYELRLIHGDFDPRSSTPWIHESFAAFENSQLHIVQFATQPLQDYRDVLTSMGVEIRGFLANHAHIVELPATLRAEVEKLSFVRWVGPYHPAYRVEDALRVDEATLKARFGKQRYSILLFETGEEHKKNLAQRLTGIGGYVDRHDAGKFLMEATLTPAQLLQVVQWDEVQFVDRWTPLEKDMDLVRAQGGAAELETVAGYTGQGVRGESFDTGFNVNHPDFASRPPLQHGGSVANDSHGTACLGICFGDGTGDAQALGLLPDGQPIAADYNNIGLTGTTRYNHTGELTQAPYFAVFQTASVGSGRTTSYSTISADHDTLLFDWDVLHCQSQSNAGNQDSRPQAWAKNVVSGGAFNHYNTADTTDDCWCSTGSIGPAADGRIKPDLSFYYDSTYTTYTTGSGYGQFGGTSGATPSICGHFGLFFEMWSDGIFGNEVDPLGTVFENRPHMTTAKAFMINTANQYPFTGTGADMTRVHQGWGVPNVKNLYDLRDNLSFIDETVILENTESAEFNTFVEAGAPALRVTMTYADPAGNPASSVHRINDLTLKVTSPGGAIYWGNNGLLAGNWSTPGGSANTVDTVENVFVQNPEEGLWVVEVIASEINQDSHVETPQVDADFALVVSGALIAKCSSDGTVTLSASDYACEDEAAIRVVDCDIDTDPATVQTVSVTIASDTEPGGETVLLTESSPSSATFVGSIPLSATDGAGTLQIAEGDIVTATYVDADDGLGGTNVSKTDTAGVDCTAPAITNVVTSDVQPRSATITFDTDEASRGTVRYGTSCAALTLSQSGGPFVTAHSIVLQGLSDSTTYFYAVDAADFVGNVSTDDNAGSCYTFTTPDIPDYFTEVFTSGADGDDTDFTRVTFTPNASVDQYAGCTEAVSAFGTDPAGGTSLTLTDDDSEQVTLTGGASVSLYGVSYTSLFVGSNGYVTFTAGDSDYSESTSDHFDLPRVSAVFDDLNPASAGNVSYKQEADRIAITWQGVPEYNTSSDNNFQIELFFDGTISITYLQRDAVDGISGLSAGAGVPADFFETDLTAMGACGGGAGTVPGEASGTQMMMVTGYDESTDTLTMTYEVPCQATDHVIEFGELTKANLESYAWSGQECSIGASGSMAWDTSAAPASIFWIVVANNGSEEGSYGTDSVGNERPEDSTSPACTYTQNLVDVCQ